MLEIDTCAYFQVFTVPLYYIHTPGSLGYISIRITQLLLGYKSFVI